MSNLVSRFRDEIATTPTAIYSHRMRNRGRCLGPAFEKDCDLLSKGLPQIEQNLCISAIESNHCSAHTGLALALFDWFPAAGREDLLVPSAFTSNFSNGVWDFHRRRETSDAYRPP